MNSDFPRILTLLRKERGISQKQAAQQLGISQALLSHYEKGIRECGLDFVVKVSDFYHVSCDYLLGRSPDPGYSAPAAAPAPAEPAAEERHPLLSAVSMLLRLTDRIDSPVLSKYVESYFSAAVYRMFRQLYRLHPKNEQSLFTIPAPRAELWASHQIEEAVAEVSILADDACGERLLHAEQRERAALTTDILTSYGAEGSDMLRLIREEEETLKK